MLPLSLEDSRVGSFGVIKLSSNRYYAKVYKEVIKIRKVSFIGLGFASCVGFAAWLCPVVSELRFHDYALKLRNGKHIEGEAQTNYGSLTARQSHAAKPTQLAKPNPMKLDF